MIEILPEEIVRGIAAGEVVERPASALKELIENAMDAGARRVDVEWREAGRRRLRVTDDGTGMTPADARLALERHATSKLRRIEDLETVGTFGFRGEALPSIAAVTRLELLTRPAGAAEAWAIKVEGGKKTSEGPAGAPAGTTVTADDLFFSVPARLKFLKSDATERALLLRTAEDAALACPGVAFRILAEGRETVSVPGLSDAGEGWLDRLAAFWGAERAGTLKPIDEAGRFLRVSGWVSDVNAPQSTGRYQRFFINRRPVVSRRLNHALYDGYRNRLLVGRHPAALLFLEIDPAFVDVNVHPAKREVRLSHEEEVHDFLSRAVANALSRSAQSLSAFSFAGSPESQGGDVSAPDFRSPAPRPFPPRPGIAETQAAFALQSPPVLLADATEGLTAEAFRTARFEPVAQLYGTYLLARLENQFFLFDQHAADERSLFESLSAQAESGSPALQPLLIPYVWESSPEAAAMVEGRRDHFEKLGFSLEPFGGGSVRVMAVPAFLGDGAKARGLLEGLAEDLLSGRCPRGWEPLLIRAACLGSVRAGDSLALPEMDRLIRRLQESPRPWTCPHGRPTFLRLSDQDLAQRFRRT